MPLHLPIPHLGPDDYELRVTVLRGGGVDEVSRTVAFTVEPGAAGRPWLILNPAVDGKLARASDSEKRRGGSD